MSQWIPKDSEEPYARIERNHAVRPGNLPSHRFAANKLAEDHGVDRILPGGLDLA